MRLRRCLDRLVLSRFAVAAVAFLVFALPPGEAAHAAGKRLALVIGNSAYQHAPLLKNPRNDADDLAAMLEKLGFTVIKGIDLDKSAMDRTIQQFAAALHGADAGVFFYAGHGLQVNGVNYLVPTDAVLASATAPDFELVRLDVVQRSMERESATNILFLDACRNNPLARNLARSMGTRSAEIGRGLAAVESGVGTLISFSTQPGNVAFDGGGRNSPFTAALLRQLAAPREDLSSLLINVRNDVMSSTQNQQVPWEHSALRAKFFFAGGQEAAPSVASVTIPAAAPAGTASNAASPDPAKPDQAKPSIAQLWQAAPTKTQRQAEVAQAPPAAPPIAAKAASADVAAPMPIDTGEIVKGRLAANKSHYWQIKAPAGRYRIVLDVRRADDASSNLMAAVEVSDPDGRKLGQLAGLNEIDVRRRLLATLDTTDNPRPDLILRVTGASAITDYWLGLFPADAAVPFPYFVRTPRVDALALGHPAATTLAPLSVGSDGAWYATDLDAQDYRVSAQVERTDGIKGNVMAHVDMFGPIGESRGGNGICNVNAIDQQASCARKLVFSEKTSVLFRIRADNDVGYKLVFKVDPLPSE
ncbi:MAG: caspase family protein [Bradyrhizobium sp.]|nr:caspase family protein [Bradyrhizobium sp.]